ncbi:MupG family TIM beta-alpha barrel fold protein [Ileibacterium valens]|uniref:MupG family TIM beta-alpha barrel fold protein n=1 Tax=Ileibacterium valens TaxID=1862668 RepID=UPI003512B0F3
MPTMGISVYPDLSPFEEIKEYLALAGKYGAKRVFSSMFSVEGTKEEIFDYFRKLIEEAHKYGMEVSLDVNTRFLDDMGVTFDNVKDFADIGCDIIRMDEAYGDYRDTAMINNPYGIKIEYNASTVSPMIGRLLDDGADKEKILACHNFYPQPWTGMPWAKFKKVNQEIKDLEDIRIGAFISSNAEGTNGVWDAEYGLPTVERMRNYPVDLQARLILATDHIDDVLFGNYYASEDEFKAVADVLNPEPVKNLVPGYIPEDKLTHPKTIKIKLDPEATKAERKSVLEFAPHADLGDSSEWIWRSRLPRVYFKDTEFAPRDAHKDTFERGDVVVVNDNYKHYAGEVHIVLEPMKNDGLRNLVGKVSGPELDMIDLLKPNDVVVFEEE